MIVSMASCKIVKLEGFQRETTAANDGNYNKDATGIVMETMKINTNAPRQVTVREIVSC